MRVGTSWMLCVLALAGASLGGCLDPPQEPGIELSASVLQSEYAVTGCAAPQPGRERCLHLSVEVYNRRAVSYSPQASEWAVSMLMDGVLYPADDAAIGGAIAANSRATTQMWFRVPLDGDPSWLRYLDGDGSDERMSTIPKPTPKVA